MVDNLDEENIINELGLVLEDDNFGGGEDGLVGEGEVGKGKVEGEV